MSLECSECENSLRVGHAAGCSRSGSQPCAVCGVMVRGMEKGEMCGNCEMNEDAHMEWERDRG